jgi:hypothetical protein
VVSRVESPVGAWPYSKPLEKEGCVQITGSYRAAEPLHKGWKKGLLVWLICSALFFGLWMYLLGQAPNIELGVAIVGLALIPALWIVRMMEESQIRKLDVRIFPDKIEVRGKSYERDMRKVQFSVEPHSRAAGEEAAEIKAQKRGRRFYREAVEVVMQYGEKRVVVAGMKQFDKEKAVALMIRLQDTCDQIDDVLQAVKQGKIPLPARAAPAGALKPVSDLR